jgi:hypothetical protein
VFGKRVLIRLQIATKGNIAMIKGVDSGYLNGLLEIFIKETTLMI